MTWPAKKSASFEFKSAAVLAIVVLLVLPAASCRKPPTPSPPARPDPAAHFEQTQANTATPHGRIVPGSAQEVVPGFIDYQTDQGVRMRVRYTWTGDGYRYDNPQRVDESSGSAL